jgi:hypothetical protein
MTQPPTNSLYRIDRLEGRLNRLFVTRAVLSTWGFQYQLCEVGPFPRRLDPRILEKAFSTTLGALKTQVPGLLSNPDLTQVVCASAAREAENAAAILKDALNSFDPLGLATVFHRAIAPNAKTFSQIEAHTEPLALISSFSIPSHDITGKTIIDGRVVRFWILNDLRWLYPDDPRLWRILLDGARENSPVVIVARAISQMTFPLLKAFRSRGCQFYFALTDKQPQPDTITAANRLDLPPLLPYASLRTHPVLGILQRNLRALLNPKTTSPPLQLIREAEKRGFGTTSEPILTTLRDWAEASGQSWSPKWLSAVDYLAESPLATVPSLDPLGPQEVPMRSTSPLEAQNEARSRTLTRVFRSRVAAEVDLATWNALAEQGGVTEEE